MRSYSKIVSFLASKILCIIPFILVYLYYEYSRAIVSKFNDTVTYKLLISIEEKIFGEPLTLFFLSHRNIVLDVISIVVYALHPVYLIIYGILLLFVINNSREFTRFTVEFTFISLMGVTFYLLIPVAPPWIAIPGVTRLPNPLVIAVSALTGKQYYDPNPYAALPSLHVGLTVIFAASLHRLFGKESYVYKLSIIFSGLMSLSVLYTGNHYLMDVIMGYLLGILSVYLGRKVELYSPKFIHSLISHCGSTAGK